MKLFDTMVIAIVLDIVVDADLLLRKHDGKDMQWAGMSSLQLFAVFDDDDAHVDDTAMAVEMRLQIQSMNIEQKRQTNNIERKIQ